MNIRVNDLVLYYVQATGNEYMLKVTNIDKHFFAAHVVKHIIKKDLRHLLGIGYHMEEIEVISNLYRIRIIKEPNDVLKDMIT